MLSPHPPTDDVLDAFNLTGIPRPLAGGNGDSFHLGHVVLKPADNIPKIEWCSHVQSQLARKANQLYRVARPLSIPDSSTPSYVAHGWTASHLIAGQTSRTIRIREILQASRAMHEDLKDLVLEPPVWIREQRDRWTIADRLAWDETTWEATEEVDPEVFEKVKPWLNRLTRLKKPLDPSEVQNQIVHGDLSGNVLFGTDESGQVPPGIIDFSPYWRPVEYAEAIIVADASSWYGNGEEVAEVVGLSPLKLQMLVRALTFRVASYTIQTDSSAHMTAVFPRQNFERAVHMVEKLCELHAQAVTGDT